MSQSVKNRIPLVAALRVCPPTVGPVISIDAITVIGAGIRTGAVGVGFGNVDFGRWVEHQHRAGQRGAQLGDRVWANASRPVAVIRDSRNAKATPSAANSLDRDGVQVTRSPVRIR